MSLIFQILSVVAAVLFSYVMLVKVGMPWFVAGIIAPVAGYLVWRWENSESDGEPRWMSALSSLIDLKNIGKYVNQIF